VTLVPLAALRANRTTTAEDETFPEPVIFNRLKELAFADPQDDPLVSDWDTLIRIAERGDGEWRDLVRYFLAYEVTETPSTGECTVTIHVIEGLPFDPARPPVGSYTASASMGELDRDGNVIATRSECIAEATHRAMNALLGDAWFDPGWTRGPPAHGG
jgi:hypothetical protein